MEEGEDFGKVIGIDMINWWKSLRRQIDVRSVEKIKRTEREMEESTIKLRSKKNQDIK